MDGGAQVKIDLTIYPSDYDHALSDEQKNASTVKMAARKGSHRWRCRMLRE